MDDASFGAQLREWLKTLRKKNAAVVLATQSLADIEGSAIAPAIVESCPTRLLLPNERAVEPQIAAIYRRFGLNDRQIGILARASSEARLLLPVAARQPPVRARPRRGRARPLRRLVQGRPGRHRRDPGRAQPRWLRRRLAPPPRRGLGGRSPPQLYPGGTRMIDRRLSAALIAGAILSLPVASNAAWIVFDPKNYSENLLSAARALEQIQNRGHQPAERGADADQPGPAAHVAADLGAGRDPGLFLRDAGPAARQADRIAYDVQSIEDASGSTGISDPTSATAS